MPCINIPLDCGPPKGQGTNVLQLLWNILLALTGNGPWGSGIPVAPAAGTERVVSADVETDSTNSPVAAGARSVIFGFSTDFAGTIAGAAVDPTQFGSIPYIAPGNDTLGSIAYTVTAGTLLITKIV